MLPLPIDGAVAAEWARLRVEIAGPKRRVNVNDLWIAATARANRLPVVTQDDDFDVLSSLGLVTVIKVSQVQRAGAENFVGLVPAHAGALDAFDDPALEEEEHQQ